LKKSFTNRKLQDGLKAVPEGDGFLTAVVGVVTGYGFKMETAIWDAPS
jgi:hypothetical protein